jgi:beta-lactam-binding protein with PASTA domain
MRRVLILIAMIAAFLIVVPAALAQVTPPQPVSVPNVTGMSLSNAQQALVKVGFNAAVTQENVTDQGKNNVVLRQQIVPGKALAKGSNVPIVVGKYTAASTVPQVVGARANDANQALLSKGFKVSGTYIDTPMKEKDGYVNKQNPPAGQTVNPGTVVTLEVYRFKEDPTVKMPNLVGMKHVDANNTIQQLGLIGYGNLILNENRALERLVKSQNHPPGTSVKKGAIVMFEVYMTVSGTQNFKALTAESKKRGWNPPITPDFER